MRLQSTTLSTLLVSLGALDRFDMSGTFLNGLLEKIHLLFRLVSIANSLIGDHLVDIVDIDEVVRVL